VTLNKGCGNLLKGKYLIVLSLVLLVFNSQVYSQKIINVDSSLHSDNKHFSLFPTVSYPGDAVLVRSITDGVVEFNETKYRLAKKGAEYLAVLPISIDQQTGVQEVLLYPSELNDPPDSGKCQEYLSAKITIEEKAFSTQYLEVTEDQQAMIQNEEEIAKDRQKFLYSIANPAINALFTDSFIKPLDGRITTKFGFTRYINGVLDSRHMAIDIAAAEGTPIFAPNSGRVVLAEYLYLSGNRVIIDHGMGLFSSFSHLSALNVQAGDSVARGEILGNVGSTGFSTGPHLHHAIYVHGYAVNPEQFYSLMR